LVSAGTVTVALVIATPSAVAIPDEGGAFGQAPAWTDCDDWVDTSHLPTARCTTVSVPVGWNDAANPQAPHAQLAVMRVPATGRRLGVVIANPGGPGISAVDTLSRFAPKLADTEIGRRFDMVAFDPRGVGLSTPQVRCETDAELDEDRIDPRVDYRQAGVAHIEDLERRRAQLCLDRVGASFLAGMSTENTARDMDAVRAALGEEQINFFGYSYGTRLGTVYAEQFPDRVRAMMLDGVVDQFVDRFHRLVDPLAGQPAQTTDPRGLSYQDAITGVDEALYSSDDWHVLTDGLIALANGTGADDLLELADEYLERDEDGHYTNLQDSFDAVHCADQVLPADPAVWAENNRQTREAGPYQSYGKFTGFAPRPTCVFWSVHPATAPHPPTSPGPGKVVVVSSTGDPATPYQVGVEVAAQLGAPLITFEGDQHTVAFGGQRCVDRPLEAFFVDRIQPSKDLRC
jgi:pimeloyl-ACP methyl ester carboxylesterase